MDVLSLDLSPCGSIFFMYIMDLDLKQSSKEIKPHACTHHIVNPNFQSHIGHQLKVKSSFSKPFSQIDLTCEK